MTEHRWLDLFCDNLIARMSEYHMTQSELAELSGLSEGTISKYMHKTQIPSVRAVVNISYALNCTVDELVDFGSKIRE